MRSRRARTVVCSYDAVLAEQLEEQRRYYERELARADAAAARALLDATTLPPEADAEIRAQV